MTSKTIRTLLWIIIGLAVPFTLLILIFDMYLSYGSTLVSLLLSCVYALVGTFIFCFSSMWPKKKSASWYWAALLWGGAVGTTGAQLFAGPIDNIAFNLGWSDAAASFAGAYPEEIIKALGAAMIIYGFAQINRPWQGFLVGSMVGLGFEIIENIFYGSTFGIMDIDSDVAGTFSVWLTRSIFGPGLHVIFTGIAGFGIGYGIFCTQWSGLKRSLCAATGLLVSFLLHFSWNYSWDSLVGNIVTAAIAYPLFIVLWVICFRRARSDRSIYRTEIPITTLHGLKELVPKKTERR